MVIKPQIWLSASIFSTNLVLALNSSSTTNAQAKLLAAAPRQAGTLYQASSPTGAAAITDPKAVTPQPDLAKPETRKPLPKKLTDDASTTPILAKHREFSDSWWQELRKCKACPPKDQRIDCKKLLKENPAWLEVVPMNHKVKHVIMDSIMSSIPDTSKASDLQVCNLACAVCAGVDPDQRGTDAAGDSSTHRPLHEATIAKHFGLFSLLLAKGANPSTRCQPAHPCEFIRGAFDDSLRDQAFDELAKYGEKCRNYR